MSFRRAAAFGLVLSATFGIATAVRAQGLFDFFEMSPRQIVRALDDDGYELHGPLIRRGDVYVCNAVSEESGRPVRLIVSARDGRVIERFAAGDRFRGSDWDSERVPRPPRNVAEPRRGEEDDDQPVERRDRMALGDVFSPPSRVYGSDSLFGPKPATAPTLDTPAPAKPKHQVAKKHKDTAVARAPSDTQAPQPAVSDAPKPNAPAMANVAPAAQPNVPAAEAPKPAEAKSADAPRVIETPASAEAERPAPKAVETPKTAASPLKTTAQSARGRSREGRADET